MILLWRSDDDDDDDDDEDDEDDVDVDDDVDDVEYDDDDDDDDDGTFRRCLELCIYGTLDQHQRVTAISRHPDGKGCLGPAQSMESSVHN